MLLASPPNVRPQSRPVLLRDRFVSGSIGAEHFENSLSVTLTTATLSFDPVLLGPRRRLIQLPLDSIVLAHVHASRLAPRIELYYQRGTSRGSCSFSPHDLHLWVEYLDELGVVLRPYRIEIEALPRRNLGYHFRALALAGLGAGGALSIALTVVRVIAGQ